MHEQGYHIGISDRSVPGLCSSAVQPPRMDCSSDYFLRVTEDKSEKAFLAIQEKQDREAHGELDHRLPPTVPQHWTMKLRPGTISHKRAGCRGFCLRYVPSRVV
jgi:hypothetical protein